MSRPTAVSLQSNGSSHFDDSHTYTGRNLYYASSASGSTIPVTSLFDVQHFTDETMITKIWN